jgi:hypothetical protein
MTEGETHGGMRDLARRALIVLLLALLALGAWWAVAGP